MKKVQFSLLSLIIAFSASAQIGSIQKDSSPLERVYFGGGMDLQFNSVYGLIGASPAVGYMLTSSSSVGIGITYQYLQLRNTKDWTDFFGYRFFVRQNLFSQLFAYAEYERMSIRIDTYNPDSARGWVNNPYVGGGWFQPFNDRAGFQMIALYNVRVGRESQFVSPWSFRGGFTFSPF